MFLDLDADLWRSDLRMASKGLPQNFTNNITYIIFFSWMQIFGELISKIFEKNKKKGFHKFLCRLKDNHSKKLLKIFIFLVHKKL